MLNINKLGDILLGGCDGKIGDEKDDFQSIQ